MPDNIDLVAEFREDQGKGASRRLRKEGKVPAIIYGAGRPPRSISLQHNKLLRALQDESFYSSVLNIKVGDKNQEAILKDIQRHPAKPVVLHVDLQRIVAGEAIRMNVPLHFIGEDVAPGVKLEGGVISRLINDVEVTCLPKNLPEYLEVDVTELGMDDILHLSDIKVPKGVELPELAQGEGHDQPVVSISKPRAVVEETDDAEEVSAEVPTIAQGADDAEEGEG
ncbi:MAG: 50S ribosomal protein L25/general stress protein Ctc [Pseudomonadota bacterium]